MLQGIFDLINVGLHYVVDNIALTDTLFCNLNTLIGSKLDTYKLLNGKLEL